jgi:hypothetical protein
MSGQAPLEMLERGVAPGDEIDRKFIAGQVFHDELRQARIVFDQQYTIHGALLDPGIV